MSSSCIIVSKYHLCGKGHVDVFITYIFVCVYDNRNDVEFGRNYKYKFYDKGNKLFTVLRISSK